MGIVSQAADSAAASGAKVATVAAPAAYSFTALPLSTFAAGVSIALSLFYFWSLLPRIARTAVALKRGLINKDWSLWRKLGDQPPVQED